MKYLFLTSVFISSSFLSVAQGSMLPTNNEQQIKDVIAELFNGYRTGDSLQVRNTFTNNATFQSAYYSAEGQSTLSQPESINAFITYIGGGLDKEHDEQIWNTSIKIDNYLASVWTQYAFYLDGKFSHCGSENFLLIKVDSQWRIFHLVDTRQKSGCEIPYSIKNR